MANATTAAYSACSATCSTAYYYYYYYSSPFAGENNLNREFFGEQNEADRQHETNVVGTYGDRATEDRWAIDAQNAQDRWAQMQGQGHQSGMATGQQGHEAAMLQAQLQSDLMIQGAYEDRARQQELIEGAYTDRAAQEELIQGNWGQRAGQETAMQNLMQGFQGDQRQLDREHDLTTGGSLQNRADLMREFKPGAALGDVEIPGAGSGGMGGDSAAFSMGADKNAQLQRGAQRNISDMMGNMGYGDARAGGMEAAMRGEAMGQGQNELSNLLREQAIMGQQRENDVSDRNLSAALAQRGQNINQRQGDQAQRQAMLGMVFGGGGRLF